MFAGIVEQRLSMQKIEKGDEIVRIELPRPAEFNDISIGDSIAINGVCLTVESFSETAMQFALAAETLKIIRIDDLENRTINLERSLKLGDRIHGHFVSGHVDALAEVVKLEKMTESLIAGFKVGPELTAFIWKKGSVAINGVSLTVNEFNNQCVEVCLIPETLRQTNLGELAVGDFVNVEVDQMARGIVHAVESKKMSLSGE